MLRLLVVNVIHIDKHHNMSIARELEAEDTCYPSGRVRLPLRFESKLKLSHMREIGRAEIEPAVLTASCYSRLDSLADRGAVSGTGVKGPFDDDRSVAIPHDSQSGIALLVAG